MLAPWKKSYDKPRQHIKKQGHYFANKIPSSQNVVFPVVMFGCESWTIKKAGHQRIDDAFELCCWRRLLRVLWTARRSNLSILKEVSSEHSLEGLMLKLKFQNFGFLMRGVDWLIRKDFAAGKDWRHEEKGTTGWDGWMASLTRWAWVWASSRR